MAVDPAIQELLAQNALIADALYDLVQLRDQGSTVGEHPLLQDAKTKVNALDPSKFVFP